MYSFNFLGKRVAVFFSFTRLAFLFNTQYTQGTRNNPATRQLWFYPLFIRVTYPMVSNRKVAKNA